MELFGGLATRMPGFPALALPWDRYKRLRLAYVKLVNAKLANRGGQYMYMYMYSVLRTVLT